MERIDSFLNVLEELERTPKTNDKIKLLEENALTGHLKEFLSMAVCETVKFNIKELKDVDAEPAEGFGHRMGLPVWDAFERIATALKDGLITGHKAVATINNFLDGCTDLERKWYERCFKKDIASTKVGRKIMDTVWPGSVLYWKCMLAEQEDKIEKVLKEDLDTFIDGYAYGELKKNGMRTFQSVFSVEGNGPTIYAPVPVSRKGLPIVNFFDTTSLLEHVVAGTKFENYMFEGECSVDDNLEDTMSVYGFDFSKTEDDFRGKSGKVGKGWEKYKAEKERCEELRSRLKFTIFDLMPIDEWNVKSCKKNYEERRADLIELKALIAKANLSNKLDILESRKFNTYTEARKWADEVIANGYEGIIIKSPKHLYEWVRSRSWIKCKEEVEEDVVIIGYIKQKQKYNGDGTLKADMLGKFIVIDPEFRIFEIGTGKGWSEQFYIDALNNFEENYLKKVMKILAQKFTKKAAVLGRFNMWRDDKAWQDVVGEDYDIDTLIGSFR